MADISKEYIDELIEHSGIKGQKWYQRRYQNPDGTYTELGKMRKRQAYESVESMSTAELREKTERKELENRYKRATQKTPAIERISNGKKAVMTILGVPVAITAAFTSGKKLIEIGKDAASAVKLAKDRVIGKVWLY